MYDRNSGLFYFLFCLFFIKLLFNYATSYISQNYAYTLPSLSFIRRHNFSALDFAFIVCGKNCPLTILIYMITNYCFTLLEKIYSNFRFQVCLFYVQKKKKIKRKKKSIFYLDAAGEIHNSR
jgi:uncharacterized membrane-anchored protein YitT (DUF2179 family)